MKRICCKFYLVRKKIKKNKKIKSFFEKKDTLSRNIRYKPNLFIEFNDNLSRECTSIKFNYITSLIYHPSYPRPKTNQLEKALRCKRCSCSNSKMTKAFIDLERLLFIREFKIIPLIMIECNLQCTCSLKICQNRLLQREKKKNLKLGVEKAKNKGWGLIAKQCFSKGRFICEYVGEVINEHEANRRGVTYDQSKLSYLWTQGDVQNLSCGTIDATRYGNIVRFANHSCNPNCFAMEVLVENKINNLCPRIGIFTGRNIKVI